ncbi:hypothetical protein V6N11_061051 [Hibiscus sabdariffa]|uniref:Cytochrome P450 n=1 Tax=Hibiscus sabdariffa TaxID=183260 RepID=A0ABR2QS60_9ROSI
MSALMELLILFPCCFFLVALMKFFYDYLWIPLRIQHVMNSQGTKGPPYRFVHGNNKEVTEMRKEAFSKPLALKDYIFPIVQPDIYTWINTYEHDSTLTASVETMLEKWKGQEGKEIEVFREFRLLTSEVISRTAFSNSYLAGEKILSMLIKLSIIISQNIFKTRIPFISKLWKPADLLESEQLAKEIKDRLLVNAYHNLDEKNRLSLEDLVDECKTLYVTGQETVNSFLAWTILHLAVHGDWQETARREVVDIFDNQNPDSEGISKLKTMTMITNETLRLYGPANGLMRKVGREVQIGKLVLPANLLVAIAAFHHDPPTMGRRCTSFLTREIEVHFPPLDLDLDLALVLPLQPRKRRLLSP